MEAVLSGCPAFAISHDDFAPDDFTLAAAAATVVARAILERGLEPAQLLNVNVPAIPLDACAGIEVTRLGKRDLPGRADPARRSARRPLLLGRRTAAHRAGDPRDRRPRRPPRPGLDHADPAGPDRGPLPRAPAGLGAEAPRLSTPPRPRHRSARRRFRGRHCQRSQDGATSSATADESSAVGEDLLARRSGRARR